MNVLACNAGSNSLKFEIVSTATAKGGTVGAEFGCRLLVGGYDNIGKSGATLTVQRSDEPTQKSPQDLRDYAAAAEAMFEYLDAELRTVERIGHRVVHGAHLFDGPATLNDDILRKIGSLSDLAPLHNEAALQVIGIARKRCANLQQVAVFDTTFHRGIPEPAALYGLPISLSRQHQIRRYGFHGVSHQYLLLRYAQLVKRAPGDVRAITLHLEGGSSVCAIQSGQSIDTSMGFTPLEGLMMGTRSGDLDPAIVPYLMKKQNWSADEVENLLNRKSGLLGVSGMSADTRELIKHLDNEDARLALAMFGYRVKKYIGAYLAVLGGTDAVVFSGGIGENTALVRKEICTGLTGLGIELDENQNEQVIDREGLISKPDSRIPVWVIPTREALMVAELTAAV